MQSSCVLSLTSINTLDSISKKRNKTLIETFLHDGLRLGFPVEGRSGRWVSVLPCSIRGITDLSFDLKASERKQHDSNLSIIFRMCTLHFTDVLKEDAEYMFLTLKTFSTKGTVFRDSSLRLLPSYTEYRLVHIVILMPLCIQWFP